MAMQRPRGDDRSKVLSSEGPPRNPEDPALTAALGSRAESTPLEKATVRTILKELRKRARSGDEIAATLYTNDGEDLITLYMRRADETLGYPSFRALLLEWWPLELSTAYERVRVAKFCTSQQAAKYGYAKCRAGTRLGRALGLTTLEALEPVDLRLPKHAGGGTVRFADATCAQLEAAQGLFDAPTPDDISRSLAEQLSEARAWVAERMEKDPEIAALEPTVFLRDRKVSVRVTAVGPEQAAAAARLYRAIAKRG